MLGIYGSEPIKHELYNYNLNHAHRSPPVDQQNSASTVETDQPEHRAIGTKRARMMPGSKIVLPSSDVEEYSGNILRSTIFRIANPKGIYYLFDYNNYYTGRNFFNFLVGVTGIHRNFFLKSDNRPSWWPKDVVFSPVRGQKHTQPHSRCFQN